MEGGNNAHTVWHPGFCHACDSYPFLSLIPCREGREHRQQFLSFSSLFNPSSEIKSFFSPFHPPFHLPLMPSIPSSHSLCSLSAGAEAKKGIPDSLVTTLSPSSRPQFNGLSKRCCTRRLVVVGGADGTRDHQQREKRNRLKGVKKVL